MNEHIIEELQKTSEYYDSIGDEGRSHAYKRAITSIENYDRTITSGEQAKQLKWIGDGIAAKIDSILGNDVNSHNSNNRNNLTEEEGESKKYAFTLIDKNSQSRSHSHSRNHTSNASDVVDYRSIRPDLRKQSQSSNSQSHHSVPDPREEKLKVLNKDSRVLRVKQYEYSNKPENASVVSRGELGVFVNCAKKAWEKIVTKHNSRHIATIECCGSYRRGSSRCHECVILFKSDIPYDRQKVLFKELLYVFTKLGLLLGNTKSLSSYTDTYQGVLDLSRLFKSDRTREAPDKPSNLPVLLKLVAPEAWPCALLKWTGPSVYWAKLQTSANRSGYELTENGLYYKNKTSGIGKRLYHRDEYSVLMDIGMEYVDPLYRG